MRQFISGLTRFSVKYSETLRHATIIIIIASAALVVFLPLALHGDPLASQRVPLYILSFNILFALSLAGEYSSIWLQRSDYVCLVRCGASLLAILMALNELVAFLSFSPAELESGATPIALSSLLFALLN